MTSVLYIRVVNLLGPGGGGGLDGNWWQAGHPSSGVSTSAPPSAMGSGKCWMVPAVGTCHGLGNGDQNFFPLKGVYKMVLLR